MSKYCYFDTIVNCIKYSYCQKNVVLVILFLLTILDFQNLYGQIDIHTDTLQDNIEGISKTNYLMIEGLQIIGNRRTKEQVILRELSFEIGDVFLEDDMLALFEEDKSKLIRTRLFLSVDIEHHKLSANKINVLIKVIERWYIFPFPIFKIHARNFNDWWQNLDRDFNRTSYGAKFYHYNIRGRNEKLKLQAQFGFIKDFEIRYQIPYLTKRQKNGLLIGVGYRQNNQIVFETRENKQKFIDFGNIAGDASYAYFTFTNRPSFYTTNSFTIAYQKNNIHDSIAILNPNYFQNSAESESYFRLKYRLKKDHRNEVSYPLRGYLLDFSINKLGLGISNDINQLEVNINYYRFFDLSKNYYLSTRIGGKFNALNNSSYKNARAIGYKPNSIRGYELYVVDGQSFILHKTTFKKRLFKAEGKLGFLKAKQFNTIPIAVYLKTYFDWGYVSNNIGIAEQKNSLANQFLYGTGLGLDIVTYYDFVLRIEYSLNNNGDTGFFINFKSDLK